MTFCGSVYGLQTLFRAFARSFGGLFAQRMRNFPIVLYYAERLLSKCAESHLTAGEV